MLGTKLLFIFVPIILVNAQSGRYYDLINRLPFRDPTVTEEDDFINENSSDFDPNYVQEDSIESDLTGPEPWSQPVQSQYETNKQYDHNCSDEDSHEPVSGKYDDYIECRANKAFLRTCPDGLHFNPAVQYPNYPCDYPPHNDHITQEPHIKTTPKPITTKITKEPYETNVLYDYVCTDIDGYEPISNSCEDYVECKEGIAFLRSCPDGLHFNPAARYPTYPCVYPSNNVSVSQEPGHEGFHPCPQLTTTLKPTKQPVTTHKPWTTTTSMPVTRTIRTHKPWTTTTSKPVTRTVTTHKPWTTTTSKPVTTHKPWTTATWKPVTRPVTTHKPWTTTTSKPVTIHKPWTTATSKPVTRPVTTHKPWTTATSKPVTRPVTTHIPWMTTTSKPVTKTVATRQPWTSPTQKPYDPNMLHDYVCREVNGYEAVPDGCDTYVECEEDEAFLRTCPYGFHFNPAARYPNEPCIHPSTTLEITTTPKPITTSSTTRKPWTSPTQKPYDPNILNDYVCKEINGYEAVPDRCDTYVECEEDQAFLRTCPYGYHFNPAARYPNNPCVHPSIALPDTEITTTSKPITTPSTTRKPWTPPTQKPYDPNILYDYVCRKINGYEAVANSNDAYVECKGNQAFLRKCPRGFHFNPAAWYPNKPCIHTSTTLPDSEITTTTKRITTPSTTRKPWTPPTQKPYDPNILYDYVCRKINGYEVVANRNDAYIECKENQAFMRKCPNGFHFDPTARYPNKPCVRSSITPPVTDVDLHDGRDLCGHRSGIYALPTGNCTHYLVCKNNIATIMPCPAGLAFNPTTSTCDWAGHVPGCNPDVFEGFTCPPEAIYEDEDRPETVSKYRYKSSCKEYIACLKGHPRLLSCDKGKYFDQVSETCVDSKNVVDCQE